MGDTGWIWQRNSSRNTDDKSTRDWREYDGCLNLGEPGYHYHGVARECGGSTELRISLAKYRRDGKFTCSKLE